MLSLIWFDGTLILIRNSKILNLSGSTGLQSSLCRSSYCIWSKSINLSIMPRGEWNAAHAQERRGAGADRSDPPEHWGEHDVSRQQSQAGRPEIPRPAFTISLDPDHFRYPGPHRRASLDSIKQCFWSGFSQVRGSWFGSRRAKMTHKSRKKLKNCMFWSAECSLLSAELFFGSPFWRPRDKVNCSFGKKKFFCCKFSSIFAHQNPGSGLDLDSDGIQPKMLDPDPDPYKMNTDPKHCHKVHISLEYHSVFLSSWKTVSAIHFATMCTAAFYWIQRWQQPTHSRFTICSNSERICCFKWHVLLVYAVPAGLFVAEPTVQLWATERSGKLSLRL